MVGAVEQKRAYDLINAKRQRPWRGEEEVRIAWVSALEQVLDVHFDAERAKKDSSYNNVIIEFKGPGFFKGSKASAKYKEATQKRLLPYIIKESNKQGIPEEDFIGIAIDGEHISFSQVQKGVIQNQHLLPFSEYSVGLVMQAIHADTRRAITIDHLMDDFCLSSLSAVEFMQGLSDALSDLLIRSGNSKIKMLYEEWKTLYGQVADMSALQHEAINKELRFTWKGDSEHRMSGRLFVVHTYNSLLIKLLAAEIVSAHGLTTVEQPAQSMAALEDDDELLHLLSRDIEKAGIFREAGIEGFIEEAIFGWYLDVCSMHEYRHILSSLRRMLAALSLYRTDKISRSRDVLRDLYQALVPGKLRQSLGEFYTPDWLVDFTVDQIANESWLSRRILDPTCGSGAFLIEIIRRYRKEAAEAGMTSSDTLKLICSSVWGFDLNPLAVQTSRVNFLMEIADLLREADGERIEIPVLLADALYSPAQYPEDEESAVTYQIGSKIAGLSITLPRPLAFNRKRLDQVFTHMNDCVETHKEFDEVYNSLILSELTTEDEMHHWDIPLRNTYDQILNLHKSNWNGIWFRIVRNFFWSAASGRFDCIVGNPPWVRWSKLPELYRSRVKPTCESYAIFSENKRHGGNELDISAMITYTAADKWLKSNGRLAFVLTGTLFKNPSSAGFRHLKLNDHEYLKPVEVNDMKMLKPFSDAANHTVVAVFDKGIEKPCYPVSYNIWEKASGFTKNIPVSTTLEDVKRRVCISHMEATPVDRTGSPWAVLERGRHEKLKLLSGVCSWTEGRKGITTDLNGVFFVKILEDNGSLVKIETRPDAGKKVLGTMKKIWVEPDLLFPLIKGAGDFSACYVNITDLLFSFVPNVGIRKAEYQACESRMTSAKMTRTREYFTGFSNQLNARSTYRRQMAGAPFYAVYNVGEFTFKPWKVIWPEMSGKFYAAVAGAADVPVVGERPFVPDHKIYFAAFDDKETAFFLCGLLNSSIVKEWIESHTISIQIGNIFKHLDLPAFKQNDKDHMELANLVDRAHNTHDTKARGELLERVAILGDEILEEWLLEMGPKADGE